MSENSPAPGWYPAPHANNEERYWDGAQWSENGPAAPGATSVAPKKKLNTLALVAMIAAIVGFIFACIPGALIVGWILLPIAFILSIVSLFLKGDKKWFGIVGLVVAIIGTVVGFVVFFAGLAAAVDDAFGDESPLASQSSEPVDDDEAEGADEGEGDSAAGASFTDNTLTLDDFTVTITDVKKIAVGEPGNEYGDKPVVAFWYEVTNTSGRDLDPTTAWIGVFTAIQDNDANAVNELQIASLPDPQFLETQIEQIKEGGTVANAVAYSLDDEMTPVELVASNDFGFTEIGRASFPIG